jgi:hypothetical protein
MDLPSPDDNDDDVMLLLLYEQFARLHKKATLPHSIPTCIAELATAASTCYVICA